MSRKIIVVWILASIPYFTFSNNECIVPFEAKNGMIVIEGRADKVKGKFILDTGAPSLILNAKYFDGITTSDYEVTGFGGEIVSPLQKTGTQFNWGCINKRYMTTILVNLDFLEQSTGDVILGLIGFDVIKTYELVVDYAEASIKQSANKIKKGDFLNEDIPTLIIPFYLKDHLIMMDVTLGGQSVKLALDSGSKSNLIYHFEMSSIDDETQQIYVVGVDQNKVLSNKIKVTNTTIQTVNFKDMDYVVSQASNELIRRLSMDGLLGGSFLNQWNRWAINYKKQEIYLWK